MIKNGQSMHEAKNNRSGFGLLSYLWNEWFSTFFILLLLLLTLIIGTGELIHGELLRTGERLYGDPSTGMQYSFLRAEPEQPQCERYPNIDALVQQQMQTNAKDDSADFFGTASTAEVRQSVLAAQQQCEEKYAFYDKSKQYLDAHSTLRSFRDFEIGLFGLFKYGTDNNYITIFKFLHYNKMSSCIFLNEFFCKLKDFLEE